jgi:hypothetical protein
MVISLCCVVYRRLILFIYLTRSARTLPEELEHGAQAMRTQLTTGPARALVFGGMTFFSAVMAPLVFTKLPAETAGRFIRARDAEVAGQAGAAKRFERLHRTSVLINGLQWMGALGVLIYVLL